jgi:hypothetical protein
MRRSMSSRTLKLESLEQRVLLANAVTDRTGL